MMPQAAKTLKQKEYYDMKAKENTYKVGDLVLYKNHHRTKLAKKWLAYYRIYKKKTWRLNI